MFNPMSFFMNAINRNPGITNNPMAQNMVQILQSGDAQKGQQMAENLCKTYGVSKEQATSMAMEFFRKQFNIPF